MTFTRTAACRLMREDLKRSGLTPKDILVEAALRDLQDRNCAGYYIPYPDPKTGKPNGFYRFRYCIQPGFRGLTAKPSNYTQPSDTPPRVYFPRHKDWARVLGDSEERLFITEGEKKRRKRRRR